MTYTIKKNATKKEVKDLINQLKLTPRKYVLKKHFAKSEVKLDALEFQKKVRNEWH